MKKNTGTLAELPLGMVLMMDHHPCAAGMLGYEQQRWHVALISFVVDHLLDISIPPP